MQYHHDDIIEILAHLFPDYTTSVTTEDWRFVRHDGTVDHKRSYKISLHGLGPVGEDCVMAENEEDLESTLAKILTRIARMHV